jgi:hypothetical protein
MQRLRYKLVINKTYLSMNKITLSNKFVLMIATMLPAVMLATSLTLSLVPVTAFAQEVETEVDVGLNLDVNTHVITDEEDCDEASDEVSQENDQHPTSETRSDGNVGAQVQTTVLVAENINVDTDIVPEGCNPNDRVNQDNDQRPTQIAGDVETDEDPITNLHIRQDAVAFAENRNVDTDATIPLS